MYTVATSGRCGWC